MMMTTMKPLTLGLVLIVVWIQLLGCAAAGPDFAKMISEGSEVRTYEVFGMDCPGCHGGLENLVNKVPGVRTSKANWDKQQLHVAWNPGVEANDEAIHEAIKRANFTLGKRLN